MVLNINVLSCISAKRHKRHSLQAPFLSLIEERKLIINNLSGWYLVSLNAAFELELTGRVFFKRETLDEGLSGQ